MEKITYFSTRGHGENVSSAYAIVHGIAEDGGLFVPDHFPKMDVSLEKLVTLSYQEIAFEVMKLFLTDFTEEELRYCIEHAYDDKFDTQLIAPLTAPGVFPILELFHGATLAFKDMALSILPYLMSTAAKKENISEEIVILTATSGDTGKAALEGFADVPGVRIIVFYPKDGVSEIQRLQMVTQRGNNTSVVAMLGNFDDAQRAVKEIFTNPEEAQRMKEAGFMFSSANSINIGRLIPQVVYYYWAYAQMVQQGRILPGELIDFAVPTGNFGNILAAYYAKQTGLPVHKLLCASNKNNVLTDFFHSGHYDANRPFYVTSSPSMDILVSSNLERLLYHANEGRTEMVDRMMYSLKMDRKYDFLGDWENLQQIFWAGYTDEEQTRDAIGSLYHETGYVMDPHTAVAYHAARQYRKQTMDQKEIVVVSTASPYKFPASVLNAIGVTPKGKTEDIQSLEQMTGIPVPENLAEVLTLPVRHQRVCAPDKALEEVRSILKI